MIPLQRCSVPFSASFSVYALQLPSSSGEDVGNKDMLILGHLVTELDSYISRKWNTVYLLFLGYHRIFTVIQWSTMNREALV